jgi:hypothetical protein
MSTISDAMKKKRDQEDHPSPETVAPRVVHVEVPKDHSVRNTLLAAVLGALVLGGAVLGGYSLLGTMGAFDQHPGAPPRPKAAEQPAVGVSPTTAAQTEPAEAPATGEQDTASPATPTLEGIFPDPIEPTAVINGRRCKLGGLVDGFKLVAVEDDRVVVEREGKQYELVLK